MWEAYSDEGLNAGFWRQMTISIPKACRITVGSGCALQLHLYNFILTFIGAFTCLDICRRGTKGQEGCSPNQDGGQLGYRITGPRCPPSAPALLTDLRPLESPHPQLTLCRQIRRLHSSDACREQRAVNCSFVGTPPATRSLRALQDVCR